MKTDEIWSEALRLLHKFCPQSRSKILTVKDFSMGNVYGVFKCLDPKFMDKRFPLPDDQISENLLRVILGKSIELEVGRALAIPDLDYPDLKPIICSAKTLLERVSEGIMVNFGGKDESMEFICGGNTLFVFETTGRMLMFDSDYSYCLVEPKVEQGAAV